MAAPSLAHYPAALPYASAPDHAAPGAGVPVAQAWSHGADATAAGVPKRPRGRERVGGSEGASERWREGVRVGGNGREKEKEREKCICNRCASIAQASGATLPLCVAARPSSRTPLELEIAPTSRAVDGAGRVWGLSCMMQCSTNRRLPTQAHHRRRGSWKRRSHAPSRSRRCRRSGAVPPNSLHGATVEQSMPLPPADDEPCFVVSFLYAGDHPAARRRQRTRPRSEQGGGGMMHHAHCHSRVAAHPRQRRNTKPNP